MASSTNEWTIVGKACLVTGANTGIGYCTALELARRGARRVILACRNVDLAKKAVDSMKESLGGQQIPDEKFGIIQLDLSSMASVRQCANQLLENEPELNVLVANAAVHAPSDRRIVTEDGFELTMATNHLGHFLLVQLLMPLLKKSAPSRIVVVASAAHAFCWPRGLDIDDLNAEKPGKYGGFRAYCQSKLANVLFVRELNKRLNSGQNISVFAVHPGFVRTTIARRHQSSSFLAIFEPLQRWFALTPEKGAETSLFCACEPGLERNYSGCYFSNSKPVQGWHLSSVAKDDTKAERLWSLSEQMTKSYALTIPP